MRNWDTESSTNNKYFGVALVALAGSVLVAPNSRKIPGPTFTHANIQSEPSGSPVFVVEIYHC